MRNTFIGIIIVVLFSSCATKKEMLYFQDIKGNEKNILEYNTSRVQINDILYIKVTSLDGEAAESFNVISTNNSNSNLNQVTLKLQSYIVSPDGDIVFPIIGNIKVDGKTTVEVQELIKRILEDNKYLISPVVSVRIINSKVTILGEVKNPGTFDYTEQNITIPQALGYAGDLTIYGRRTDVLLIRLENGLRTYNKLDLTSTAFLNSPYYYVKQNDVIIVNPNYSKMKSSGVVSNLPTILSIIASTITIYALIQRQ
jgi:polysaccharide export outer membrane protein